MTEHTLESLTKRISDLESKLALLTTDSHPKDWRSVVGMFADSESMRAVDAEIAAFRDAERKAIAEGSDDEFDTPTFIDV